MRNLPRVMASAVLFAALHPGVASAEPPAADSVAWAIVADLTTQIGPRPAGSAAEARARAWAEARLTALGFSKVTTEPFMVTAWTRGAESALLTAPYQQNLAVTALGYSVSTGDRGIEAELVYFPTIDALRAAPDGSLAGKIAFIDHAMRATMDGSSYGQFGDARRSGPAIASRKGAVAALVRSAGTDNHRLAHAGYTVFDKADRPIPAGAVSAPDADLIARIAAMGKPLKLAVTLTGHPAGKMPSGNVIGELPGRDPTLPPVLVACHLDSWDLGTGALDDGAGCAIITAAALRAQQGGRPLRTIRVLWTGSEEIDLAGGKPYGDRHAGERHALAMEADFGAARVWRVQFNFAAQSKPIADRIATALAPLGIQRDEGAAHAGTDIKTIVAAQGLPVVGLTQDGTQYFDVHHTADDTLDKIDPGGLEQAVTAWATVLGIVADEPTDIVAAEPEHR